MSDDKAQTRRTLGPPFASPLQSNVTSGASTFGVSSVGPSVTGSIPVPGSSAYMVPGGLISPSVRRIEKELEQRAGLIAYLRLKLEAEDWHAVADAAMDLREIDATLAVLRS
jgi:hypothetical protein